MLSLHLSCSPWQQPAGIWRHWDSIWWKQRQWPPCLRCSVQKMEPAQLQGEETQQGLRTGDGLCLCAAAYSLSSHILKYSAGIRSSVFRGTTSTSVLPLQAMVIINGHLYVFGGTTGYLYSTDLHRLNLATREWTQLKPNNALSEVRRQAVCKYRHLEYWLYIFSRLLPLFCFSEREGERERAWFLLGG